MSRPRPAPSPVYALADVDALGPDLVPGAVTALARAGVGWIQIRAKSLDDADLYRLCAACFDRLDRLRGSRDAPQPFPEIWMDDRADLACLFPFAGLHLGQRDLPPSAARRVVKDALWIGASTHDREQLERAAEDPEVDLVAVGPIFPTRSKEDPDPVVGLDLLRWAQSVTDKPLVAIGGIDAGNVARVLEAGADSAAVLGAVGRGVSTVEEVEGRARELLAAARS